MYTENIKKLSGSEIDQVIALEHHVHDRMLDKDMFIIDTPEKFLSRYASGRVTVLGCFVERFLIASLCYSKPSNGFGYSAFSRIPCEKDTMITIGSCCVDEKYRGHGLQTALLKEAERLIRLEMPERRHMFTIAHPDNTPSYRSLVKCGFTEINAWEDCPIDGMSGLKRILFYKSIQ